jgi:hypothetical protein
VIDETGNESPATETLPLTVVPPARPAARLDIASSDVQNDRLILSVSNQL